MAKSRILIGTSGFSYNEWKGIFYPEDLAPKDYLSFYSKHFKTTEINNTFYKIPSRQLTEKWYQEVPSDFSFTLKLSQRITHQKRLKDVDQEMLLFLDGAAGVGEKLGPILVQLPPYFRKDEAVLKDFVSNYANRGKLAFEFRHESWFEDSTYALLSEYGCALAAVETEETKAIRKATGTFIYVRLRKGEYDKKELEDWKNWINEQGKDVYCYIKHDEKAPVVAEQFLRLLQVDK